MEELENDSGGENGRRNNSTESRVMRVRTSLASRPDRARRSGLEIICTVSRAVLQLVLHSSPDHLPSH